jgi:Holliday junction resolvasome RuvABC endonuclease subunit
MSAIKIAAFDPAMRNWGMAALHYTPGYEVFEVVRLELQRTESEAGKKVRKSSDDLRRATECHNAAFRFAEWADVIVAEAPEGTQSARSAFSNGMSIGLLAALGMTRPLFTVDPYQPKKIATGRKTATKDEMIAWAISLYPTAPWLRYRGEIVAANEHLADAMAIAHAAVKTPEFRAADTMHSRFTPSS